LYVCVLVVPVLSFVRVCASSARAFFCACVCFWVCVSCMWLFLCARFCVCIMFSQCVSASLCFCLCSCMFVFVRVFFGAFCFPCVFWCVRFCYSVYFVYVLLVRSGVRVLIVRGMCVCFLLHVRTCFSCECVVVCVRVSRFVFVFCAFVLLRALIC